MRRSSNLFLLLSVLLTAMIICAAQAQTLAYSKRVLVISGEKKDETKKLQVEMRAQEFLNSDLIINNALPDGEGLYVELTTPAPIAVPLQNVFAERDFVFIDEELKVAAVAEKISAHSEKIFPEPGEEFMVKGLLQLNSGDAKKYGIKPGDRILLDFYEGEK